MRYLWVEDFDGDSEAKSKNKENWENYFEIENHTFIPENLSLEGILQFLDDKANWRLFDVILIDIRFKVCSKLNDEDKIYQSYYSNFLTREKFDQYTAVTNSDPNSASSGILLYLALVHRYNYSQNRIAFISANVDGTGNTLVGLKTIKEYLYKAQYISISEKDKEEFSLCNETLYNLYKEYARENNLKEKDFPIPETDNVDWNNTKALLSDVKKMEVDLISFFSDKSKKMEQLKYSSVKEEFEKVGLIVPLAFEKPEGETEDISWAFRSWKDNMLNLDYYKLRSSIIPICMSIEKLIEESKMSCFTLFEEKNMTVDVKNMMSDIIELFPENVWTQNNNSLYIRIVKECVSLCDIIKPQKDSSGEKAAAKAVLKITRNWMSHQGIKKVEAYDVAFMFYSFVIIFFECDNVAECNNYRDTAKKLVLTFEDSETRSLPDYSNIVSTFERVARNRHEEAYSRFKEKVGESEAKRLERKYSFKEDTSIYETISAIGNEYSDIRETVSMEYIYLLYLGMLDLNRDNVLAESLAKRLVRSKVFEE